MEIPAKEGKSLSVADGFFFFHLKNVCLGTLSKYDKSVFIYFYFLLIDFLNSHYC